MVSWRAHFALKDTRNCPEKAMKISHFNPNQSAPSIYIMIELCFFSLDQWEIRIHLLWGKSFNIPLHCDPHLNQTKWLIFNELLPLTIPGVLKQNTLEVSSISVYQCISSRILAFFPPQFLFLKVILKEIFILFICYHNARPRVNQSPNHHHHHIIS